MSLRALFLNSDGSPRLPIIVAAVILFMILVVVVFLLVYNKPTDDSKGIVLPIIKDEDDASFTDSDLEEYYFNKGEVVALIDRTVSTSISSDLFELIDKSQRDILLQVDTKIDSSINALDSRYSDVFLKFQKSLDSIEYNISRPATTTGVSAGQRYSVDVSSYAYDDPQNKIEQAPVVDQADKPQHKIISFASTQTSKIILAGKAETNDHTFDGAGDSLPLYKHITTDGGGLLAGVAIPGILRVGLISSRHTPPAIIEVSENIYYDDILCIPAGSLFFGSAVPDMGARKIFVYIDRLLIENKEIIVSATGVDKKMSAGFCSKYIDISRERFLPTFLLNFSAGMLNCFRDVVNFVGDDNIPVSHYPPTIKNLVISGTSTGVREWTDSFLRDARSQDNIIVVNSGIDVFVVLDKAISLEIF